MLSSTQSGRLLSRKSWSCWSHATAAARSPVGLSPKISLKPAGNCGCAAGVSSKAFHGSVSNGVVIKYPQASCSARENGLVARNSDNWGWSGEKRTRPFDTSIVPPAPFPLGWGSREGEGGGFMSLIRRERDFTGSDGG